MADPEEPKPPRRIDFHTDAEYRKALDNYNRILRPRYIAAKAKAQQDAAARAASEKKAPVPEAPKQAPTPAAPASPAAKPKPSAPTIYDPKTGEPIKYGAPMAAGGTATRLSTVWPAQTAQLLSGMLPPKMPASVYNPATGQRGMIDRDTGLPPAQDLAYGRTPAWAVPKPPPVAQGIRSMRRSSAPQFPDARVEALNRMEDTLKNVTDDELQLAQNAGIKSFNEDGTPTREFVDLLADERAFIGYDESVANYKPEPINPEWTKILNDYRKSQAPMSEDQLDAIERGSAADVLELKRSRDAAIMRGLLEKNLRENGPLYGLGE
jgi:hypothetical protein